MHALYAAEQKGALNYSAAEKELLFSIDRSYDLYLWYLRCFVDLQRYAQERIEAASKKRLPTHEDLNPNLKFLNNSVLSILTNSPRLLKKCDEQKISWYLHKELLKELYEEIKKSRDYQEYMDNPEKSFAEDKAFIIKLFKYTIANFEPFHQLSEDMSIYLIDDVDLVCSMVIRNLKSISNEEEFELLDLYYGDQEEERGFALTLLKKTIVEWQELEDLITPKIKNWEIDRLALIDTIIIKMGIVEAKYFDTIPTKVTLNEYIDLAKFYSTAKSGTFINGVLDSTFQELKEKGVIVKIGRGLSEQ